MKQNIECEKKKKKNGTLFRRLTKNKKKIGQFFGFKMLQVKFLLPNFLKITTTLFFEHTKFFVEALNVLNCARVCTLRQRMKKKKITSIYIVRLTKFDLIS